MTSPKAAKILRRTLVGGTLAATVALILWLTGRSAYGEPVYWAAALAVIGVVFEVSRMGRLSERTLQPVLLVAAGGALLLVWRAIENTKYLDGIGHVHPSLFDGMAGHLYLGWVPTLYAWTAMLAAASFTSLHALGRVLRRSSSTARIVLYVGFGALILRAFAVEPGEQLRLSETVTYLWILILTTLPLVALDRAWTSLEIAVGLALWFIPPLPGLWQVWSQWGIRGLVALLVLSKIGDTAGYYVGSAIGKSHPFPKISPGKTTAGCVASLVTATAFGGALAATGWLPASDLGIAAGLVAGALVNVAAQSGDLFESWVKRRTGVKDSSRVFGPAGGVLDQVDSLLFSVPVASLTWPAIFS